jgi:hypothetical protein
MYTPIISNIIVALIILLLIGFAIRNLAWTGQGGELRLVRHKEEQCLQRVQICRFLPLAYTSIE